MEMLAFEGTTGSGEPFTPARTMLYVYVTNSSRRQQNERHIIHAMSFISVGVLYLVIKAVITLHRLPVQS